MAESFNSDDLYNLIEMHLLRALWEDVKLGGLVQLQDNRQYHPVPATDLALNALAALGATALELKNTGNDTELEGNILAGQTFTLTGDATTYTVGTTAAAASDLVTVAFAPGLAAEAAADTALATLSVPDLQIRTWRREHPEDIGDLITAQLPALSVQVTLVGQQVISIGNQAEDGTLVSILFVDSAARSVEALTDLKYAAARAERLLQQQEIADKQLADLPAAVDGGQPNSIVCIPQGFEPNRIPGGVEDRSGPTVMIGEMLVGVALDIILPED